MKHAKLHPTVKNDLSSIQEEIANAISHGLGALIGLLSLPFIVYLGWKSGDQYYFVGSLIYSVSFMMVFLSSTLYHMTFRPGLRRFFRILDHISIFFLIAGSYTPFIFIHVNTGTGWTIFMTLWIMAAVGSAFKWFFTGKYNWASLILYLVMGWMAVFMLKDLVTHTPSQILQWLITGGVLYTLGTVFYVGKRIPYNHFIWHLFVLAGAFSHLYALYLSLR